jgi:hypothetical protein
MFVMAMVYVSVCVCINDTGAYCSVQVLCCVAVFRYCGVQRLVAFVLCSSWFALVLCNGLHLVCWVAVCRSSVEHCIIALLLCSGLPLVCCAPACLSYVE